MEKIIFLFFVLSTVSLTGCVVGNMDSSDYEYVNYVQTFQNKESIGHTDPQKRKKDLHDCGVPQSQNLDDGSWSRGNSKSGETLRQAVDQAEKIESCMLNKGYIVYGFDACGPLKAPTGLCN